KPSKLASRALRSARRLRSAPLSVMLPRSTACTSKPAWADPRQPGCPGGVRRIKRASASTGVRSTHGGTPATRVPSFLERTDPSDGQSPGGKPGTPGEASMGGCDSQPVEHQWVLWFPYLVSRRIMGSGTYANLGGNHGQADRSQLCAVQ